MQLFPDIANSLGPPIAALESDAGVLLIFVTVHFMTEAGRTDKLLTEIHVVVLREIKPIRALDERSGDVNWREQEAVLIDLDIASFRSGRSPSNIDCTKTPRRQSLLAVVRLHKTVSHLD